MEFGFKEKVFVAQVIFWTLVWSCLLLISPGPKSRDSIWRLSASHGVVVSITSITCFFFYTELLATTSAAISVAFFVVDGLNMAYCDLCPDAPAPDSDDADEGSGSGSGSGSGQLAKEGEAGLEEEGGTHKRKGKRSNTSHIMDYVHHVLGVLWGVSLTFQMPYWCDSPRVFNAYVLIQTNEISTPFYAWYRLTNNQLAGMLFTLAFFLSRIVFNSVYLIPLFFRECPASSVVIISGPYQLLQYTWFYFILLKLKKTWTRSRQDTQEKKAT